MRDAHDTRYWFSRKVDDGHSLLITTKFPSWRARRSSEPSAVRQTSPVCRKSPLRLPQRGPTLGASRRHRGRPDRPRYRHAQWRAKPVENGRALRTTDGDADEPGAFFGDDPATLPSRSGLSLPGVGRGVRAGPRVVRWKNSGASRPGGPRRRIPASIAGAGASSDLEGFAGADRALLWRRAQRPHVPRAGAATTTS